MKKHLAPHRIIGRDAITAASAAASKHLPGKSLLLVCDDATWIAAGEAVQAQLASTHTVSVHSLGRHVRPLLSHTQPLIELAAKHDGLVAVGSGTINDVTKYAAAQAAKPYMVVTTAASMNGYAAANASLEDHGFKHTHHAQPPRVVIGDSAILTAAPKRLTRAGLADTLCRSTVEADMLMSHLLFGTGYPQHLFEKMRVHEAELIAGSTNIRENDPAMIQKLMHALLDAGEAMTEHGSSAVASQGEHMIAHTLEMNYGSELRNIYHGEMIAITTLTMGHLQHKLLLGQLSVKPLPRDEAQILRLFSKKVSSKLHALYQKKTLSTEDAAALNARLVKEWPDIKNTLLAIMVPPNTIERAFMQTGLATRATEIGFSEESYRFGCTHAYLTRDRFTFLDLAVMNDKRVS